jgi:hypothetical protein
MGCKYVLQKGTGTEEQILYISKSSFQTIFPLKYKQLAEERIAHIK